MHLKIYDWSTLNAHFFRFGGGVVKPEHMHVGMIKVVIAMVVVAMTMATLVCERRKS